ncbi:MAG: sodium/solute symporter [bacterium]|nr:sodium/solute symporter [bacterium]
MEWLMKRGFDPGQIFPRTRDPARNFPPLAFTRGLGILVELCFGESLNMDAMEPISGIRTGDLFTLFVYFAAMLAIGVYCGKRMTGTEGYFVGGRRMPGWAVGISMLGTAISSVTFLAYPGSAFEGNWSLIVPGLTVPLAVILAIYLFIPYYRRANLVSVNEYLEMRFAPWARAYGCVAWSIMQFFRMGIILYLVALAINAMSGYSIDAIILFMGVLIVVYTVLGGIEAVIWTDVIQTIVLLLGGVVCIVTVFFDVPGGMGTVFSEAWANSKFDLSASLNFDFTSGTLWVLLLYGLNQNLQEFAADQTKVQRFCAPSTNRKAIDAALIGGVGCIPTWAIFMFVGTCLWVYYQHFTELLPVGVAKDQVFPHFILTELPIGVSGFVIAAVLAAAMSSIDSSLNGTSAVLTTDIYRRFLVRDRDDAHYLNMARILTLACGVGMILSSWGLNFIVEHQLIEQNTVLDMTFFFYAVLAGGVGGLFFLGFFSKRANAQGALTGAILAVIVTLWLSYGVLNPSAEGGAPLHKFMIGVVSNFAAFVVGYFASFLFAKPADEQIDNLTAWTWKRG